MSGTKRRPSSRIGTLAPIYPQIREALRCGHKWKIVCCQYPSYGNDGQVTMRPSWSDRAVLQKMFEEAGRVIYLAGDINIYCRVSLNGVWYIQVPTSGPQNPASDYIIPFDGDVRFGTGSSTHYRFRGGYVTLDISDDWVRARMRSRVDDSVFDEWVIYPGPRASVARG
jgi:hypothetical protein